VGLLHLRCVSGDSTLRLPEIPYIETHCRSRRTACSFSDSALECCRAVRAVGLIPYGSLCRGLCTLSMTDLDFRGFQTLFMKALDFREPQYVFALGARAGLHTSVSTAKSAFQWTASPASLSCLTDICVSVLTLEIPALHVWHSRLSATCSFFPPPQAGLLIYPESLSFVSRGPGALCLPLSHLSVTAKSWVWTFHSPLDRGERDCNLAM
jgi:hypothetical protein